MEHSEKNSILKGELAELPRILLVGNPNVGKSVLFNALTGLYTIVSNYPGTTVDIFVGKAKLGKHHEFTIIDTPGLYSLSPITEEEQITRKIIFNENPDVVVHVIDAKNIERMLPLTLQLIYAGLKVILVLNMFDELSTAGITMVPAHIEHDLGIPVVQTTATKKIGIDNLFTRIIEVYENRYNFCPKQLEFNEKLQHKISRLKELIHHNYPVSSDIISLLLLEGDTYLLENYLAGEKKVDKLKEHLKEENARDNSYHIAAELYRIGKKSIDDAVVTEKEKKRNRFKEFLDNMMTHPVWGIPFLFLVVWLGLYEFVGVFGAGTLVNLIEEKLFKELLNPYIDKAFTAIFSRGTFFELFAGEYGIFTLGIRYAFAIVLPIVAAFFFVFSIIEDSGYLTRLSMLVDRIFKKIGLNGRAIIPLTLGLGCDTMGVIVTRTLETKKERLIATFLLALTIPCSAQLGIILSISSQNHRIFFVWLICLTLVFLLSGWLTKKLVGSKSPTFYMEMIPLRLPKISNVLSKTFSRLVWYLKEVVPIFILASVIIWLGRLTGLFDLLIKAFSYPVKWAGMPEKASQAFLYGFFRRDYGAAGLLGLTKEGVLVSNSLAVALVVMTLFVPCVAQFAITWKERGWKTAVLMSAIIFPFAFIFGIALNAVLNWFGIRL